MGDFCRTGVGLPGTTALAKKMPSKLAELDLNFTNCDVKDDGAIALAERMPTKGLVKLRLLMADSGIAGHGAIAIASQLRQGLVSLCLDFNDCKVGDAGATAFADALPRGLEELR